MENQYNNGHQNLKEYIDYGRIQRIEKARLAAHYAVEKEFNKRLTIMFITHVAFSILITLGIPLLLAAGVYYFLGGN